MLFEVIRTTGAWPPCKKAKEHQHTFTASNGREGQDKFWVVELNTLEEFTQFLKTHGMLVVSIDAPKDSYHPGGSDHPGIEIYDDYRE